MNEPKLPDHGRVYCLDTASLSTPKGQNIVFLAIDARSLKIAHLEMHSMQEQGSYKQFILTLAEKEKLNENDKATFVMGIDEDQAPLVVQAFPFITEVIANPPMCRELCKSAWAYLAAALKKEE